MQSSSDRLPLTMKDTKASSTEPKLVHPALNQIPQQIRFALSGLLGNVLFIVLYNMAIASADGAYSASTIYSIVYFLYIPITHCLVSLLVFGWPSGRYIQSLLSNYPIGLTGMALGAACTSYLDKINFNERVEDFIRRYLPAIAKVSTDEDEKGEFYSSLLVLVITSVWGYTLSVMVNSQPTKDEDKEKKEL
jgi:hypothetical protein